MERCLAQRAQQPRPPRRFAPSGPSADGRPAAQPRRPVQPVEEMKVEQLREELADARVENNILPMLNQSGFGHVIRSPPSSAFPCRLASSWVEL